MTSYNNIGQEIITINNITYLCSELYVTGADGTGWEIRKRNDNSLITTTGIKIKEIGIL